MDRKGTVLATSTDVYNVILDCSVLTSKESYLEPNNGGAAGMFPGGGAELQLRGDPRFHSRKTKTADT